MAKDLREPGEYVWKGNKYVVVQTYNGSFQIQDIKVTKSFGIFKEFEVAVEQARSMDTNDD